MPSISFPSDNSCAQKRHALSSFVIAIPTAAIPKHDNIICSKERKKAACIGVDIFCPRRSDMSLFNEKVMIHHRLRKGGAWTHTFALFPAVENPMEWFHGKVKQSEELVICEKEKRRHG